MKFKSSMISVASGSLGGTTYSHNRFGSYMRNRSVPVNPQSGRQSTVRSLLAALTQAWGSELTATQRSQWSSYAANVTVLDALGDPMNLTGLNHYVRSNLPILQAGLDRVDDGPVIFSLPGEDSTLAVTCSAATQLMSVSFDTGLGWVSEDGAALLVSGGLPKGPAINFFNGPWRYAGLVAGDSGTPPTSPQTLTSPFTIQEGQQLFVRARIVLADGRLSNFSRASCTCAA